MKVDTSQHQIPVEVELRDVSFQYPGTSRAQLRGFNLKVKRGSRAALLGPSGCAKTTALRLIAGLEAPSDGQIFIRGEEVANGEYSTPPQRREVGYVFQDYALFPHLSVRANIAYGLFRMPRSQRAKRVDEMLELVRLTDFATRYPHQLSGGQAQRVAIARALAPSPHVLLLDEPFSNLDEDLRASVRSDLSDLLEGCQVTSILVTHDRRDAEQLCDQIVLMRAPEGQEER